MDYNDDGTVRLLIEIKDLVYFCESLKRVDLQVLRNMYRSVPDIGHEEISLITTLGRVCGRMHVVYVTGGDQEAAMWKAAIMPVEIVISCGYAGYIIEYTDDYASDAVRAAVELVKRRSGQ